MPTSASSNATAGSCASRRRRTSCSGASPRTSSRRGWSASTRRSATSAPTASRASATSPSSASRARSSPRSRRRAATSTHRSTSTCRSRSRRPARPTPRQRSRRSFPGRSEEPSERVIATEELAEPGLVPVERPLGAGEPRSSGLYLDGYSYEMIGERLECDTKTVDNALQRVKRKVGQHVPGREVCLGRDRNGLRIGLKRGSAARRRSAPLEQFPRSWRVQAPSASSRQPPPVPIARARGATSLAALSPALHGPRPPSSAGRASAL